MVSKCTDEISRTIENNTVLTIMNANKDVIHEYTFKLGTILEDSSSTVKAYIECWPFDIEQLKFIKSHSTERHIEHHHSPTASM